VLIARAVFLLDHGHTHKVTEATDCPRSHAITIQTLRGRYLRMFESSELVHRDRDAVAQLLRPLETAGDGRHVLVDRHRARVDVDGHLIVVEPLDVVQLGVEQLHDHLVVRLEVLLDLRPLQQRAQNVHQL